MKSNPNPFPPGLGLTLALMPSLPDRFIIQTPEGDITVTLSRLFGGKIRLTINDPARRRITRRYGSQTAMAPEGNA